MAIPISLCRNSYILSPLKVTLHPIGIPSLILKFATDFLALVTKGFCPDINVMSSTALSKIFLSFKASPTPIFRVILVTLGTAITEFKPNFSLSSGTTVVL